MKYPVLHFVELKDKTYEELYEYLYSDENWSCQQFVVCMRRKYSFDKEWKYGVEVCCHYFDEMGIIWFDDWDEGQQDVEYLAVSRLDDAEHEQEERTVKRKEDRMQYKDCIIVYKAGNAITLRANKLSAEQDKMLAYVYDNDDIMAAVSLDEVKTVLFAECGNSEHVEAMVNAINGVKKLS